MFRVLSTLVPQLAVVVLLTVTVAAVPAWAQAGGAAAKRGPIVRPPRVPKAGGKQQGVIPRRTAELDRLERMSPEQRQKALDRLPPERRQRVEQGLERYRAMNPENRERLRNFERMPVEQRDAMRQSFRRMQDLPPGRRGMVRKELQQMRGLSDSERETRMQSESFRKRFDANEQGLIKDTVANLPREQE
jgi:hypothetical protein